MKPQGHVRIVRMWRGMRTGPILSCLDDPEGLNNGDLLVGAVPDYVS
jgi:hypothetical protein